MNMTIGILREPQGENRVAMLPEGVALLLKMNLSVIVEKDAGLNARADNQAYISVGASVEERARVISASDLLLMINPPDNDSIRMMKEAQVIFGVFSPMTNADLIKKLNERKITLFSLDIIPRITRAQSMDILSSMATVSGYKAVIAAADRLAYFFPMLMTAAGTIKPARVLVLGAGVAGLMAIATAKRLGAIVHAFDVRSAAREQVLSLGGKFIEVEGAREDAAAGGYAIEQDEDFKKRQAQLIHDYAVNSEVVICTAQIPGRVAPVLLKKETVEAMSPVSVIVDLAASTGGNCELTRNGEVYVHNQVTIIGKSDFPSDMPSDASKMFGNNVINFLKLIVSKEGALNLNFEDEIVKGTCVLNAGEIVHTRTLEAMQTK
jgi:H+-translocating NAD(P) transhydrogenase subunit alpha